MPSTEPYDPTGIEYYTIPSFSFTGGTTLPDLRLAYRSFNPTSTLGTVLIPTCYGGHINTTLTFTSAPNDSLAAYHVVVVAMLGNGESASPSNKPFFPDPGELRYEDVIRATHALLTDHLKVEALEAVIGFSMGAQQAYHWAVMYPSFVKRAVVICGSARTSPHNYAFLEGPIGAMSNSIDYIAWREMKRKVAAGEDVGVNLRDVRPKRGLKVFGRAYAAWLTSASWFREGWFKKPVEEGGLGFRSVEEMILNANEKGFEGWDAEDLLVLARMWQMGDIGTVIPGEENVSVLGGGVGDDAMYEKALRSITARVLVMPCRTDQYFPAEDGEVEMKFLRNGVWAPIESVWGHAAGGGMSAKDAVWMNGRIGEFMAQGTGGGVDGTE